MRRLSVYAVVLSLLLLVLPAATQEEEGTIARIFWLKAKPGMEKQMEEGLKTHMAWHKEQNDPWAWFVWQEISGEHTGLYGVGSFGHTWSEFDNLPVSSEADHAEAETSLLPFVAPGVQVQYYTSLPKVSRPWEGVVEMEEVVVFHVEYGQSQEFDYLMKKFHQAIEKTKWPVQYEWYALVNGGPSGTYVLVMPRDSWAAFEGPEKPFATMLEEAYGRQEAEALIHQLGKVVKYSESSAILIRYDLSYIPEIGGM